jgi:hypothetical protein
MDKVCGVERARMNGARHHSTELVGGSGIVDKNVRRHT